MSKRTRLKFGVISFALILITAWVKHWLPGIDSVLVISACVPIVGYVFGETIRPSNKK